jgi:hypothetical protein
MKEKTKSVSQVCLKEEKQISHNFMEYAKMDQIRKNR